MLAIVQWIVLSSGWTRRLVAFAAGAVGALALAPVDLAVAMIVPMTVAVWLIDGSARAEHRPGMRRFLQLHSVRAAAGIGWWWGFGYFVAGFWWLAAAFLVEPAKDAWALPFGVLGVPALLACFPAIAFGIARLLWSAGAGRIFALTLALGLSEWLRGWVLTGFPWNNYGMAFGDHLVLSQAASVVGNDGLTLLVVAICAAPATLADPWDRGVPLRRLRRVAPTLLAMLALAILAGFGANRLSGGPSPTVPGVRLRIMQPNIAQDDEFSFANKDKILEGYLRLSDRASSPTTSGLADVTHLIWPESSFPFILSRDPDALSTIGNSLPPGTLLITGAARMEPTGLPGKGTDATYYNAIEVVAPGGTIVDNYDKVHLVPFGEYVPFERLLRAIGVTNFVHIPGGFSPGRRRRLLDIPGLPPVAPVICYEAIFPDAVLPDGPESERRRAGVILNVTNDGWFGRTAGPYQHFAQARLRTVEEGLPLIRAANSGISAVVDPYGRVTASLPLGVQNILDATLPAKIDATVYSRNFQFIRIILFAISFVLMLGFMVSGRSR